MADTAAAARENPPDGTYPTTCWECSTCCGALATVREGRVVDFQPNRDHPYSKGAFCIKGIRGAPGITYGPNRLLYPMRRRGARGEGKWARISWDEALDEMADRLAEVRRKYGPEAIVGATSGAYFSRSVILALTLRSIGSPNWMINQDLCGGCRAVSARTMGLSITRGEDIDNTRCALIVGRNPSMADPVEWAALKAAKKRGARIVTIDPKRTQAAQLSDLWLAPRIGTDAALALAMINVMIAEGLYDKDYVARSCHGFDELAARAMTPTAEFADIVLPKTTTLEEEEVSFMPSGPTVLFTRAVGAPQGEARCEMDIAVPLLDRMQARQAVTRHLLPWRSQREFNTYLLGDSGIRIEDLERTGYAQVNTEPIAGRPFTTPTGKIELYSTTMESVGLDPLPAYEAPAHIEAAPDVAASYPLVLVTGDREKSYHHSRFRDQEWAVKVSPDPRLTMHPDTARALGLDDGAWVRLEVARGKGACRLRLKLTDATPAGVVNTGMGWWLPSAPAPEHGALDININAALPYDGPWDPVSGSSDVRGLRCRVEVIA